MPDRDTSIPGQSIMDCPVFVCVEVVKILSRRQREALELAALGWTDVEIARAMVVSVYTARDHLRAARARLGARNTTHAVAMALVRGLISISET